MSDVNVPVSSGSNSVSIQPTATRKTDDALLLSQMMLIRLASTVWVDPNEDAYVKVEMFRRRINATITYLSDKAIARALSHGF